MSWSVDIYFMDAQIIYWQKYEQINQAVPSITTFKGAAILKELFLIMVTVSSQMTTIHNLQTLTPLPYYSTADLYLYSYPRPIRRK
jgi:hypothetical protein